MKQLARFVVAVAELAEAEGRAAKMAVFRLFAAILAVAIGAVLLLVAALMLGGASYLGLAATGLEPAGALAVVGVIILVLALAFTAISRLLAER